MPFRPSTLKSQWYIDDVCRSIDASLEGAKNWTARWVGNKAERETYVATFERCQTIVRFHKDPEAMLLALDEYHDRVVERQNRSRLLKFFRWFRDHDEAEEQAVRMAFHIVDGIKKRFL